MGCFYPYPYGGGGGDEYVHPIFFGENNCKSIKNMHCFYFHFVECSFSGAEQHPKGCD